MKINYLIITLFMLPALATFSQSNKKKEAKIYQSAVQKNSSLLDDSYSSVYLLNQYFYERKNETQKETDQALSYIFEHLKGSMEHAQERLDNVEALEQLHDKNEVLEGIGKNLDVIGEALARLSNDPGTLTPDDIPCLDCSDDDDDGDSWFQRVMNAVNEIIDAATDTELHDNSVNAVNGLFGGGNNNGGGDDDDSRPAPDDAGSGGGGNPGDLGDIPDDCIECDDRNESEQEENCSDCDIEEVIEECIECDERNENQHQDCVDCPELNPDDIVCIACSDFEAAGIIAKRVSSTLKNFVKAVNKEVETPRAWQNAPNPAADYTSVQMYAPRTAKNVTARVFSQFGETVDKITVTSRGVANFELPTKSLENGIYLYKIEADGIESETVKMQVED